MTPNLARKDLLVRKAGETSLMLSRVMLLSQAADEILKDPESSSELSDLIATCGRVKIQACIQLGALQAEERQAAKDREQSDQRELTPGELHAMFGVSEWSVNEAIRQGHLHPVGKGKRNRRILVSEYRKWRAS